MMAKLINKTEPLFMSSVNTEIKALHYIGTGATPEVIFNPSTGIFKITGRSMPEDCRNFYKPIIDWVKDFAMVDDVQITVEFDLEYFSSSTSVFLLHIMKIFSEMNMNGSSEVTLVWKYQMDDEALLEAGQEYAEIIGSFFLLRKYR